MWLFKKIAQILQNLLETTQIGMNEAWKRQLELFITPCLVLLDFNQVFHKKFENICTNFANTHKESHTKIKCWHQ